MLVVIGFIIIILAALGGFTIAGGKLEVLWHLSEVVVVGGIALGMLVAASPMSLLKEMAHKLGIAFSGKAPGKEEFLEILKLMYEIFMLGRRNGLIALEDHMVDPGNSTIFKKYPGFLANQNHVDFLSNGLKPLIDGRIKPEQLEGLMLAEFHAKEEEGDGPVGLLNMVGDSLPGIGIIAAVLGIINTMAAVADGPEKVGERVAAALTGTLLGVLGAYGFVNPLTNRVKINNAVEMQFYNCIVKGVAGFARGMAPIMAVEVARRTLDSAVRPGAEELEVILKGLK